MIVWENNFTFLHSHYARIGFSKMSDVTYIFIKINIIVDECIEAASDI